MRKAAFLKIRYAYILSYTCWLQCLFGALMLTPALCCLVWRNEARQAWAFLLPGIILLGLGVYGWRWLGRIPHRELTLQEGGVVILLTWVGASLAASAPFMFAPIHLSFSHAVFESVSGLTTTGLTLVDVTRASHGVLLWRSILQLVGGAGLAIMMVATLIGPSSPAVPSAEGRELLVPHVRRSARLVLILYTAYAAVGVLGYLTVGLTVFDAVNHTFTAIATGGFSTHPDSIGHWNSPAVEAVTIVLMTLGNLNFVTAWVLIRGKVSAFAKNGEVRLFALLVLTGPGLIFLITAYSIYPNANKALRVALFECISALTGTGFTTIDYQGWNSFGFLVVIVLMLVGGGACSTSGALKQFRVYVLLKSIYWELRRALLPRKVVFCCVLWEADRRTEMSDARLRQVAAYSFLYLASWIVGALILAAHGYGVKESLFEYASALGTVGLSLGITSPDAPTMVIWTETIGMFLGRLEFFVVLAGVIKLLRDTVSMVAH